jgi:hypothetical protein
MDDYECRCGRTVDPDLEPSPGEPELCADCWWQREREEQYARTGDVA